MHFLFNLSLLIILFFLCFSISKRKGSILLHKRTGLIYCVISLVLCYIFSYPLSEVYVLDLRIVPFVIGSLYLRLSPILGLLVILMRSVHGLDAGFFLGLVVYSITSFILWKLSPWFLRLTSKYRILFAVALTLLFSIGILAISLSFTTTYTLDLAFAYLVVPPLGVAIISYIIEMIEKNILLTHQLIKAEKLEAIEQMGAAITHEIRNPLTTAIGFVELLDKSSIDIEKRAEYLSILKEELDAAERIIQDYLTFSKPIKESEDALNAQEELIHVIKLLQPFANYHSVKMSYKFYSAELIDGDRSKFQQGFINIIKNLIEWVPNGGTLVIGTKEIKNNLVIYIHFNGLIMSKEQLAHNSASLMVAYSVIREMKGTIEVNNEEKTGTTFQFSFKKIKYHSK